VIPSQLALAAVRDVREVRPWHGPARGFDFAREVQPVLNKHCVACHDGQSGRPDLRPQEQVPGCRGRRISKLGVDRMHPKMLADTGGILKYTPAYEALIPYIRRVSIEDDVRMLAPGEYHVDTSELIQILRKGHQGVRLDPEAWDRLVTWIDLNGPCHGTWGDAYPIPDGAHERRMELRRVYGGPPDDPETIPERVPYDETPARPGPLPEPNPSHLIAASLPPGAEIPEKTVELSAGVTLGLVRIPAGSFVMGDAQGEPDEWPLARVTIDKPFWMGTYEVTNAQFRLFDPRHRGGYYQKRHARSDDEGLPLDDPRQPVVRVSWEQATAFCRWLSQRTGLQFTLPTEAQWEYACRAGTATPLHYGVLDTDFSAWANLGDLSFGEAEKGKYVGLTGGLEHVVLEGSALSDRRFDDGFVVTAPVGRLRPNAWGLYDMHGNAAEWTGTTYKTCRTGGPDDEQGRKVARGGSFFDRPERARSAFRLAYPPWQRVFNVGFRVVCEDGGTGPKVASSGMSSPQ
jgi:formylglycine-generating enzyme required for sulfatase activity